MTPAEIKKFIESYEARRTRTIAVVDFGNVIKWQETMGWRIGMRELGNLVKAISGRGFLRRFYYGSDFGPDEASTRLSEWCRAMLEKARMSGFEITTKRVKYIHTGTNAHGYQYDKKCDLDVEMTVDLIQERDNYDSIMLFSGDGDLMRAIQYLKEFYGKRCIVMSARGHIGREVLDAKAQGTIEEILFAEDFESRLNMDRFKRP